MSTDQDDRTRQAPSDPALDGQIRAHFAEARQKIEVPVFETVMARAEAADAVAAPPASFGWLANLIESGLARLAGGAAVAAAAVLVVFIAGQPGEDEAAREAALITHHEQMLAAAENNLLASLRRTTRWQAPSDRWLAVETDIDIFGLPEIGSPEVLKEKGTWL